MPKGIYKRIKPTWNKDKKWSKEVKEKISKSRKGQKISDETKKKMSEVRKGREATYGFLGKKHTLEARRLNSEAKKGENNPRWKGGITELRHQIRNCFEYRMWRSDVFHRDRFICQNCNKKGTMRAHHIKPFGVILEEYNIMTLQEAIDCSELWDINNGITLCEKCHQ